MTEIEPISAGFYLIAIVLFILGLKFMGHPKTAVKGNRLSLLAMLIAVTTALSATAIINPWWIAGGLAAGAAIGLLLAYRVQMTEMPELVAILNGFGGLASSLVALGVSIPAVGQLGPVTAFVVALSILVGVVTFTGSLVAYGKLGGRISAKPVIIPGQKVVNLAIFFGILTLVGFFTYESSSSTLWPLLLFAGLFGITLVLPIGGADMPVVISLLNSYSGVAAAATGFVFANYVLIVSGALVGASGLILTKIMCEAMNRSLANVLFGAFGQSNTDLQTQQERRSVKGYTIDDALIQLENAQSVVIVPGYGLAVAQAQHTLRELEETLTKHGVQVRYAIHPVAGRMPGHMNVLLAEAKVDYDHQVEMEQINPEFESTDLVIVVGANDVTNPAARNDPKSPIYGMPILDVDRAKHCIILKRSLSPGFAGIDNELFYRDNTMMIFGDAKKSLVDLVNRSKAELAPH